MARFLASQDDHYPPNVWPAVTDAILLMASIFIVLSVVSMMSMAQKFYDYDKPGAAESHTQCYLISLPADDLLFSSNDAGLLSDGRKAIKEVLPKLADKVEDIRKYAESEGWPDYYIILEVAGHTDNIPRGGTRLTDGNWELANDRANEVINLIENYLRDEKWLRDKFGIRKGKAEPGSTILRSSGYSHHLPRKGLEDRDHNRRVELRLFAQPIDMVQVRD
jgi:hypothetical protein